MNETETLTQKVEPLLDENVRLEISESRLPNTEEGRPFGEISSVGLDTLRKKGVLLAPRKIDLKNFYHSYAPEPEDCYG